MPFQKGYIPWNKNLSKDMDARVQKYSNSVQRTVVENGIGFKKGYLPWNKGRKMPTDIIEKRTISYCQTRFRKRLDKIRIAEKSGIEVKLCQCGCGEFTLNSYIHGHNYTTPTTNWFWSEKNRKHLYYQSSYELKSFQLLEQLTVVKSYERCCYIIAYEFNGKVHTYAPDILVTYITGEQEVVEVKPKFQLQYLRTKNKIDAATAFFSKSNIRFSVWTEQEIFGGQSGRKI